MGEKIEEDNQQEEINSNSFCEFFISVCINLLICEIFLLVKLEVR